MKENRNLPKLEDFEVYSPSRAALARARNRTYESAETLTRGQLAASWICRVIAAAIMIETLFFKFTGAPESVYIFSKMGTESWWRCGQGIWELAASLLLLTSRLGWAGGILTLGALGGAIVSHITVLGIEVQGDHELLFAMGVITFVCGVHRDLHSSARNPLLHTDDAVLSSLSGNRRFRAKGPARAVNLQPCQRRIRLYAKV